MPYLPGFTLDNAQRPTAIGKDLSLHVRLIEERYRRSFPAFLYRSLIVSPTPAQPGGVSGAPGATHFDSTWREPVPQGGTFQQPHGGTALPAGNDNMRYREPFPVHARVERVLKEKDLKRYGFDKVRTMIAYIPLSFMDAAGATIHEGDVLVWDGREYTVVQYDTDGFWMNTNIRLFGVVNLESRRMGA